VCPPGEIYLPTSQMMQPVKRGFCHKDHHGKLSGGADWWSACSQGG
jgi:hypothetical protein